VRKGALFAVVSGATEDGAAYISAALQAGAQSLLLERSSANDVLARFANVPALIVDDLGAALGPLSHAALRYPAKKVAVTGVTGTNGKTTIVGLVRQCFEALGRNAASLGTLGYCHKGRTVDFGMTTPNADLVAEFVHQAHMDGVNELAMEVSSHALALGRVDGLTFEVGGYINLTQDHLDFHGTFDEYAAAKRRLFEGGRAIRAVIHTDDSILEALTRELRPTWGERLLCVGQGAEAGLRLVSVELGLHETVFAVAWRGEEFRLRTKLLGEHNVSNWLVALGILIARGVALTELVSIVPDVEPAPGRLQRCDSPNDEVCVLVDYAHTPDALERALGACRALQPKAVWCVFGCGGDRDRTKRPVMGEISARLADVAIITNDNPRTEQPEAIAAEIRGGITAGDVRVILDRAQAIEVAVQGAAPGDLVLIAGKGHEDYQIFGKTKVHFDDREVAIEALNRRRQRSSNPVS
jgi:UDP-N-acetylmuramoyl-L-alanyl-D-glutamate--2,6-diaminopimelate ligase